MLKKKSCTEKTAAKENGARGLDGSHGEKIRESAKHDLKHDEPEKFRLSFSRCINRAWQCLGAACDGLEIHLDSS